MVSTAGLTVLGLALFYGGIVQVSPACGNS